MLEEVASYIWAHSNSLIKNLTPFEDDAEIRWLNFLMYLAAVFANSQEILLSRWLHTKLISTLKFLSNWKTMFWVISQEQHSIKTLEFTENNSYFYSFTYEKQTYLAVSSSYKWVDFLVNLLADRKTVDSTPKYSLLAWNTNQASIFFLCIRYKWVNSIGWSTKLCLTRQGLIEKTPVFYFFHQGKIWNVLPRATFKNPVVNLFVNWEK